MGYKSHTVDVLVLMLLIDFAILNYFGGIKHNLLCYRCFYSMGLTKASSFLEFFLSESASLSTKPSKWLWDILFNKMPISKESEIWVKKIKLNLKISLVLFLIFVFILIAPYIVTKYKL